jgi:WhiB family redox-sensing transcriptional regulator
MPEFMSDAEAPPCSESFPDAFFPEEVEDANGKVISSSYKHEYEAKLICAECPLRIQCLTFALENNEPGIWGGTTDNERRLMKRTKRDPETHTMYISRGGRRIRMISSK